MSGMNKNFNNRKSNSTQKQQQHSTSKFPSTGKVIKIDSYNRTYSDKFYDTISFLSKD
jgi:hypothetical protein